jgi:hypothetical protein
MPEHHEPVGQTPVPGAIPDRREQIGQVPGAIPDNRPTTVPDRRTADDNSKYKEYKTPLVRALMEALDQGGDGATSAEIDSARKTLRENDAILDKAFRDMGPLMKRANNRRAAIRVTPPDPKKPAVREIKPGDPAPKDGPIPPNVPGATGPASPATSE